MIFNTTFASFLILPFALLFNAEGFLVGEAINPNAFFMPERKNGPFGPRRWVQPEKGKKGAPGRAKPPISKSFPIRHFEIGSLNSTFTVFQHFASLGLFEVYPFSLPK